MFLIYFIACTDKNTDSATPEPSSTIQPSSEPTQEPEASPEPTSEPTEPASEPDVPADPAPFILEEGSWNLAAPTLLSDVCNVGNFQDVSGFVASSIGIGSSTESSFVMLPDQLLCTRNNLDFTCSTYSFVEDTGFAAELSIRNDISGRIEDEENVVFQFDVTIESCAGIGCLLIETALPFPCLIELESTGSFAP